MMPFPSLWPRCNHRWSRRDNLYPQVLKAKSMSLMSLTPLKAAVRTLNVRFCSRILALTARCYMPVTSLTARFLRHFFGANVIRWTCWFDFYVVDSLSFSSRCMSHAFCGGALFSLPWAQAPLETILHCCDAPPPVDPAGVVGLCQRVLASIYVMWDIDKHTT